jgi:hypothetical protein
VRLRPLAFVIAASAFPVLVRAQTQPSTAPAAHGSVSISQDVLRSRARASLDRAAAFVAMAREAPAAATDRASMHRASLLAHKSAVSYRSALADFAKGGYEKVIGAARRSIEVAEAAIASASGSAPVATASKPAETTAVVEAVSGGDVALDTGDGVTPDSSPAPIVRSRYHGPAPDAPPRPENWRVLGPVPFGTVPVRGVQPNGAAGLGVYGTARPFGVVSPVQQPPFQPAG